MGREIDLTLIRCDRQKGRSVLRGTIGEALKVCFLCVQPGVGLGVQSLTHDTLTSSLNHCSVHLIFYLSQWCSNFLACLLLMTSVSIFHLLKLRPIWAELQSVLYFFVNDSEVPVSFAVLSQH